MPSDAGDRTVHGVQEHVGGPVLSGYLVAVFDRLRQFGVLIEQLPPESAPPATVVLLHHTIRPGHRASVDAAAFSWSGAKVLTSSGPTAGPGLAAPSHRAGAALVSHWAEVPPGALPVGQKRGPSPKCSGDAQEETPATRLGRSAAARTQVPVGGDLPLGAGTSVDAG